MSITIHYTSFEHLVRAREWHVTLATISQLEASENVIRDAFNAILKLRYTWPRDMVRWRESMRVKSARLSAMIEREDAKKRELLAHPPRLVFSEEPIPYTSAAIIHERAPPRPQSDCRILYQSDEYEVRAKCGGNSLVAYTRLGTKISRLRDADPTKAYIILGVGGVLSMRPCMREAYSFHRKTKVVVSMMYVVVYSESEIRIYNPSTNKLAVVDLAARGVSCVQDRVNWHDPQFPVPVDGRLYLELSDLTLSIATDQFY